MAAVYDLMLLLDTAAPDDHRAKILSDVESTITGQGTLEGKHDWGARNLTYEIDHRGDAEYHLFQFDGPAELLESLQRSLRLTDGVVRFRLIKLRPGTPPPPTIRPAPPAPPREAVADEPEATSEPAPPAEGDGEEAPSAETEAPDAASPTAEAPSAASPTADSAPDAAAPPADSAPEPAAEPAADAPAS